MIPKLIHQIWLGTKPVPAHMRPWMDSWKKLNPGWGYRLWTDADKEMLLPEFICSHLFNHDQNIALLSDIMRMELLRIYGGMYADCDFECLQPLDGLLQDGCFHYGDESSGRPGNAWLCSPPDHAVPTLYLEQIGQSITGSLKLDGDWGIVVERTGPNALARVLDYWVGEWTGQTLSENGNGLGATYPGKVVGFWRDTLYPYIWYDHTWKEFSRERYPLAKAAHHWSGSWQSVTAPGLAPAAGGRREPSRGGGPAPAAARFT